MNRLAAYHGARILAAAGILLGGIALASLFRKPASDPAQPVLDTGEGLLRRQAAAPADNSRPAESPFANDPAGLIVRPLRPVAPPPLLPQPYEPGESSSTDLAQSARSTLPRTVAGWEDFGDIGSAETRQPPATHKIVDGDTLSRLAERYLGDARRSNEIFQANRDVLTSPDILPIGAVLRIAPPRRDANNGR